jgi:hypothetical protein
VHERFAPCTVEAPFTQTRRTAWRRKQRASRRRSRRRKSRRPRRPPPRSQAPRRSRSKRDPLRRTRADMASTASFKPVSRSGRRLIAAGGSAGSSRRRRASAKPRFTLHGVWLPGPTSKSVSRFSRNACRSQTSMCHCVKASKSGRVAREELVRAGPCLAAGRMSFCQSAAILEYLADALGRFTAAA